MCCHGGVPMLADSVLVDPHYLIPVLSKRFAVVIYCRVVCFCYWMFSECRLLISVNSQKLFFRQQFEKSLPNLHQDIQIICASLLMAATVRSLVHCHPVVSLPGKVCVYCSVSMIHLRVYRERINFFWILETCLVHFTHRESSLPTYPPNLVKIS